MKKILASDKVYIRQSKIINAGRGVYAKFDIKKEEIIEKCPVIEIPEGDVSNLKSSILVTYFYYFGKNKDRLMLALGFGSIYNHSYKPNAMYRLNHEEFTIDFIALSDIKKDDEITVNYKGKDIKNSNPLWFETTAPAK